MSEGYWGSSEFPTIAEMKEHLKWIVCSTCDSPLVLRWRQKDNQPFFSCSRFHEDGCRGAMNWKGVEGFTDDVWESTEPVAMGEGRLPRKVDNGEDFWKDKYFEEKAFTMQKLHDISNAYSSLLHRLEKVEQSLEQ